VEVWESDQDVHYKENDMRPSAGAARVIALQTGAIGLGHFLVDFYMNIVPSLLPFLALHLGFSLTALGAMVTVMNMTASGLQPVFGFQIDRNGVGWMLAVNLLWIAVLMTSVGFFRTYLPVFLLAVCAALGAAFYHPLGANLTSFLARQREGPAMSLYVAGGSIGYATTPLVALPIIERYGLSSLWVLVIPGILGAAALMPGGLWRTRLGHTRKKSLDREDFKNASRWFLVLTAIVALRAWTQYVLQTFVPLFFVQRGSSLIEGGQLLTVFLVSGTLGIIGAGYITRHISNQRFLLINVITATVALVLFFFSRGFATWFLLALIGALIQAPIPITVMMAQNLIPRNAGVAAGMMMGGAVGLGGVGTIVSGVIGDYFGLEWALWLVVPIMLAATVLTWLFPNTVERPPVEVAQGSSG
jgi:FSR family fosmidomycin resistance protein-like MFS transporter